MKYVYCLATYSLCIERSLPPGLNGTAVRQLSFKGIGVLISDLDSDRLGVNISNVLAHQEVVKAALCISRSVIPCRFGTLFPEDDSVLRLLKEHYELVIDQLAKLEGKMEVSIQAIFNREIASAGVEERRKYNKAGAIYLLGRKEQFDVIKALKEEAERFSQKLHQAVSPFWSDVKVQKQLVGDNPPNPFAQAFSKLVEKKLLLNVCYLVDQRDIPSFKLAYEGFKGENSSRKLLYTGPWPPYSFANVDFSMDSQPIRKSISDTALIKLANGLQVGS
jgi:hypothetical protein